MSNSVSEDCCSKSTNNNNAEHEVTWESERKDSTHNAHTNDDLNNNLNSCLNYDNNTDASSNELLQRKIILEGLQSSPTQTRKLEYCGSLT